MASSTAWGVMALREPTSSSLPQTHPQPRPFFQPFSSWSGSPAVVQAVHPSSRAHATRKAGSQRVDVVVCLILSSRKFVVRSKRNFLALRIYRRGERISRGRGGIALRIYRSGGRISRGRGGMAGLALRGGCCRRLRGSTFELPLFHGLTPTAKCCRRIRGLLEPPGWRFGERCCRRLRGSTHDAEPFHGLTPTAKCCRRFAALLEPPGWRPGMIPSIVLPLRSYAVLGRSIPHVDARGIIYSRIAAPTAGGGFGEAVGAERGNSFPATRLRLVGLINLRMRCVCWLTTPSRFSPRS